MKKLKIMKIFTVLIVLKISCSFLTASDDTNKYINPYPATNFVFNGVPYMAYRIPTVAKEVLKGLQGYEFFISREQSVSNIIAKQDKRYISFKILTKAQKKKRIIKGFVITGIVLDNLAKSFFAGYMYRTLK